MSNHHEFSYSETFFWFEKMINDANYIIHGLFEMNLKGFAPIFMLG